MIQRIIDLFSGSNPRTWAGHGVQGMGVVAVWMWPWLAFFAVVFGLMGVQPYRGAVQVAAAMCALNFNGGWWAQRELIRDLLEKVLVHGVPWSRAWAKFKRDGANDLTVPVTLGGVAGVGLVLVALDLVLRAL